eukprot:TRINITY_DN2707_c0_g1_i3.p1 TRINITY_DN2707_c0_g1~~TRINITY_DN2707_c0_g1_i3.p1  ORF type:complete len:128 (+),score=6.98 TRINITY_DN2707_c0_g1_i3:104-487(+)
MKSSSAPTMQPTPLRLVDLDTCRFGVRRSFGVAAQTACSVDDMLPSQGYNSIERRVCECLCFSVDGLVSGQAASVVATRVSVALDKTGVVEDDLTSGCARVAESRCGNRTSARSTPMKANCREWLRA